MSETETPAADRATLTPSAARLQLDAALGCSASRPPLAGLRLSGEDLTGLDLSRLDLSGADLSRANLRGARLVGTKLSGAVLCDADLTGAELLAADLSQADLTECRADRAGFGGANLSGANLFGASLVGATLSQARLDGADLRAACMDGARLREAFLQGADLSQAALRRADLERSSVRAARFVDADLREARFRGLRGAEHANWIGADVFGVDFCGAYLVRREIGDQNYLHEFRTRSRAHAALYWLWWATSDCGRSFLRWGLWTGFLAVAFAGLFEVVTLDYGDHKTVVSSLYFSVVTLTTLGYGDVVPASAAAQLLATLEVVTGYVMLGGLLSIFSNKMARRAD